MTLEEALPYISCPFNIKKYLGGKDWRRIRKNFRTIHNRQPLPSEVQDLYNQWLKGRAAEEYKEWEKTRIDRIKFRKSQIKGDYSFDLVFDIKKFYYPLETSSIYVSGICVIAKNSKFGDLYKSKYVNEIKGRICNIAGSHQYPILTSKKNLIIKINNFPKYPLLSDSINHPASYTSWEIKNINTNGNGKDL